MQYAFGRSFRKEKGHEIASQLLDIWPGLAAWSHRAMGTAGRLGDYLYLAKPAAGVHTSFGHATASGG